MLERFTTEARRAIVLAHEAARTAGADLIGPVHLLYGLVGIGGRAAERLASLGLTLDLMSAHLSAGPERPQPQPMTRKEEGEFRRQLKARGVTAYRAEALVARIQRQRATGPVEFDEAALGVLQARSRDGEVSPLVLLRTLFASPPPDVAALVEAAGTTAEAVRRALGDL